MKQKWFWPILIVLIILGLIVISGIMMFLKTNEERNTMAIDDRIKNHVFILNGRAEQNLGHYYSKGGLKEPVLVHVEKGEQVQKGDPLFTYVDDSMKSEENKVGLELDNKMIEKEQIEGQIAAYENKRQSADSDEVDEIDAQLNWLESELTKAENNIDILKEKEKQAGEKRNDLTVTAGEDGIIADINEAQLQAFSNKEQNKPIITISANTMFVTGKTNRYQIRFLENNLKFKATTKVLKKEIFEGQLTDINMIPDKLLNSGENKEVVVINNHNSEEAKEKEKENRKENKEVMFSYEGLLNDAKDLYAGDPLKLRVQLSYKDHVWLPERFVKKVTKTKNAQGKKLSTPIKKYYVKKKYGDNANEETVTVEKKVDDQYLVTDGLTSIDVLKAY